MSSITRIDLVRVRVGDPLVRTPVSAEHYDRVVEAPVDLYIDGEMVGFVEAMGAEAVSLLDAVRGLSYVEDWRTDGMLSVARTFGYQPRNPLRHDFCTACSSYRQHPKEHAALCQFASYVSERIEERAPFIYRHQYDLLHREVSAHWRIPNSIFTSGIVNKNSALFYHRDRGNYPDSWNAMITLVENVRGGELILPEYGIAIRFTGAELSVFNAQRIVHGVAPMKVIGTGYRYSVVYFAYQLLRNCGDPKAELERIRRLKTERAERRRTKAPS